MIGKSEREVGEPHTTLRLIGHLRAACLEALQAQIEGNGPRTVLDLDEVTLVDVEAVRFLSACEAVGIAVLHGPPPLRAWSAREPRPACTHGRQERTASSHAAVHAAVPAPNFTRPSRGADDGAEL
jgi:hypothetical protein